MPMAPETCSVQGQRDVLPPGRPQGGRTRSESYTGSLSVCSASLGSPTQHRTLVPVTPLAFGTEGWSLLQNQLISRLPASLFWTLEAGSVLGTVNRAQNKGVTDALQPSWIPFPSNSSKTSEVHWMFGGNGFPHLSRAI